MWQAAIDLAAAVLLALAFVFARESVTDYAVIAAIFGLLLFVGAIVMRGASTPSPHTTDAEPPPAS